MHKLLQTLRCAFSVIAAAGLVSFGLQAANPPVQLQISITGSPTHPTPELSWAAQPGAVYLVQCKTNLAPDSNWIPVEPVSSTSNIARWKAPELNSSSDRTRFYGLVLPQPAIFRVEPAIASTTGGVLHLIGQCLGCLGNDVAVGVAGLVIQPSVVQDGTVYSFTLPALPQGTYDVAWLQGGKPVAQQANAVTVTTPPGSVLQRLLEPPGEPPGSPMEHQGNRKGINAVNVKLARMSAGSGGGAKGVAQVGLGVAGQRLAGESDDCDDGNDDEAPSALMFLMKAKEKANRTKCANYVRTFPATTELQLEEVDLVLPGRGIDLVWARTYRSRTGRTTPMGINWDHSYNILAEQDPAGIAVYDGTGRRDLYLPGTNGVYTCDEFFNEGAVSNSVFTLTFPDTSRWEFRAFDGSPSSGKISRIVDRNGNALSLFHAVNGQLVTILDSLGRTNTLGYTPDGFVSSFTDFSGRVMSYGYAPAALPGSAPGILVTATTPPVVGTPNGNDFPTGKLTRYAYSSGFADDRLNRNLVGVTDPKGQAALQVVYRTNQDPASVAFDTVDYVQRGGYRTKFRRFPQTPTAQNGFAVVKCIVNDAVGNVTEYFCDSRNRCVRRLDYTGRAIADLPTTETQNRPGNKLRAGDPDWFETRMEWDIDSLCARITHPRGNSTEMVYQRAFNQNSSRSNNAKRHDADLRVLRERACCEGGDVDGDGIADITERVWRFAYDARFGTGNRVKVKFPWLHSGTDGMDEQTTWSFARGPRQTVSLDGTYDPKESRRKVYVNQFDVDICEDFVVSGTDPRGGAESCTYDARGNRLTHTGRPAANGDRPSESYEYNAFGQLTARVHAADGEGRQRRDECAYYTSGPQTGYLRDHIADCVAAGFHLTNTFDYDARGNVIRHVDPRGFDSLATYNALDQVMTRQTPKTDFGAIVRYATTYSYDANDNMAQIDHDNRDASGALDPVNPAWTVFAEYDARDQRTLLAHELTHVAQQGGGVQLRWLTNRYAYDGNNHLVLHQLPEAVSGADPNNVVSLQYDERDQLFRGVAAPGTGLAATEQFDYDPNGECARISKIDSFTIKQTIKHFDGFNRCVQVTDAMGNVASFAFDANNNLTFERLDGETNDIAGGANNRRLSETRYYYDGLDRPVHKRMSFFDVFTEVSIGVGESVQSRTYAPNGLLLSWTDDNGHTTRCAYDTADRLRAITDPRTNVVLLARDRAGNVTTRTAIERSDLSAVEQNFVLTRVYDGMNRCISSSDNVGNVQQFGYDSRDNCARFRDARGNDIVRVFDGLNRVTDTAHFEGTKEAGITINTSHVEYFNERCVSTIDGNGNMTHYAYDSVDRQVSIMHPDGTAMSLVWSPRSNLARVTDPNGTVIDYAYDLLDRCVRKDMSFGAGSGVATTTTFEEFSYDGLSRLVRGTNNTSMVEFSYDSLGNRIKAKADCIAASATFDGEGNRLSVSYPGGRVVQYTRDTLDRVVTVGSTAPGSAFVYHATFAHDGPDRLSRIARANGINTRVNWNGLQNPPNSAGDFGFQRVSGINHARAGGAGVVDQRVFAYDRSQNKTSRAQVAPYSTGGPTATNAWVCDALHRLTRGVRTRGATVEGDDTYIIDPMGNRTNVVHLGGVDVYFMNPAQPEPADFQVNQYTLTPFGNQAYDRNGNLVFRDSATGGTIYRYDYADRLVSVERAGGVVVSFTYDALGRRISKTTYPPAPAAPVTTQFLHDPQSDCNSIIEMRQRGVVIATYVLPEVDDEVLVAFTAAGTGIYYHRDDLGNVLALTDEAGNVLEHYEYADYGAPRFLDSKGAPILAGGQLVRASPLGNPFLFRGMFWDAETGFYCAVSKLTKADCGRSSSYMDPDTGQELSRHVWGSGHCSDGSNARSFEGNNPWTGEPVCMKKGTVKFFNETKGFGFVVEGDTVAAQFNPKEYTLRKVIVRGWNPEKKEGIIGEARKEEGGRHTPFHNKRTTDVTGEIELPAGRKHRGQMNDVQSNPLYRDSGMSGVNPMYQGSELRHRPGRTVYGNITFEAGRYATDKVQKHWLPANFRLAAGGRTVGAGQVIEIIK